MQAFKRVCERIEVILLQQPIQIAPCATRADFLHGLFAQAGLAANRAHIGFLRLHIGQAEQIIRAALIDLGKARNESRVRRVSALLIEGQHLVRHADALGHFPLRQSGGVPNRL